jgi:hypothetical protein
VKRYNINGMNHCFNLKIEIEYLHIRLKDNVSISDTITSQGRLRTFSDGVLSIHNIEPSDHGSYICIISILNSTSIRSKPAIITVKCKLIMSNIEKITR